MLESKEMIYTAIFQTADGTLSRSRYTGVIDRRDAWINAAKLGDSSKQCLVALVPGDHPVYTYEDVFDVSGVPNTEMKNHDVYEIVP
tara:strand:- start:52 stop:312 length:261 start_codon:yes stop_codon:yes gene_type:complete